MTPPFAFDSLGKLHCKCNKQMFYCQDFLVINWKFWIKMGIIHYKCNKQKFCCQGFLVKNWNLDKDGKREIKNSALQKNK